MEYLPSEDSMSVTLEREHDGDEDYRKLYAIAVDELALTYHAINRSPKLRARGKDGQCYRQPVVPRNYDETSGQYIERVGVEAAKRGVSTKDLLYPTVIESVKYWELDGTNLVYCADCWIGQFESEGVLKQLELDCAASSQLEDIIPDLRLLRTPFYGAE